MVGLLLAATLIAGCGFGLPATVPPAQSPATLTLPAATPTMPGGGDLPTLTAAPGVPPTPTTVGETMTPKPTSPAQPTHDGPQLRMVLIRARSSQEVLQLRRMKLDIVRVRPDPDRPPDDESLSGGFIVEAVVTSGLLAKLKALGFEVSEPSAGP